MAKPAGFILLDTAEKRASYEQPLSERMRTFLRLEFLYQQMLYSNELDSDWGTRATIGTLLEILAILARGDIRSEVHKELDYQLATLQRYQSMPQVDSGRLDGLMRTLTESRRQVSAIGTGFIQSLKDSEFLNAIKHRSAIPGGTCEFDLPEYSHWLRQPMQRRQQDLELWINDIRPICDAAAEVLWLTRESGQPVDKLAINGMYQHNMQKEASCRLLRVTLANDCDLFPEISGSQHRFTVRFLEWSSIGSRAMQTSRDVPFELSVC
ncbi:MAG TPA: cell division protein ZapD [Woeseiaceae bacterium]|nr:cell division protein ZapD [Woeseiaceae bacterium]